MSNSVTSFTQALRPRSVTRLVKLFLVLRADGVSKAFTNHDFPLVVNGITYKSKGGFELSALSEPADLLGPKECEASGPLTAEITYADVFAKRYDFAIIYETEVDWKYPGLAVFGLNKYWVRTARFSDYSFVWDLGSLPSFFKNAVGRFYTGDCDHVHYGPLCAVKESAALAAGTTWAMDLDKDEGATSIDLKDGSVDPEVDDTFVFAGSSDETIYTILNVVTVSAIKRVTIDPSLQADHAEDETITGSVHVHTGTVKTIASRRNFLTQDVTAGLGADYFRRGKVRWTSGANNGLKQDIKYHPIDAVSGEYSIELLQAAPFTISVDDAFELLAGCDHTYNGDHGCLKKFGNTLRTGAFKDMPGLDRLRYAL